MATQLGPGDLASLLQLCGNDMNELAALLGGGAAQPQQSELDISSLLGQGLGDGSGLYDPALKGLLLQEAALSLAATMEQQRKQQQLAAALQLRALQQQQEFAALQHLTSLGGPNSQHLAYSRAFSNDLEYRSGQAPNLANQAQHYQRAGSHDLEGMGSPLAPRLALGNHPAQSHLPAHLNAPQRSFSSDTLEPRSRHPLQRGVPLHLSNPPSSRAPPQGRPSFPSARNPGPQGAPRNQRGGHGPRHAGATAKAPCWAGSDWHPLKAVLSSTGNSAAAPSGTGVFLPYLADEPKDSKLTNSGSNATKPQRASGGHHSSGRSSTEEPRPLNSTEANTVGSPACSLDGISTCGSDPWSRASTLDLDSSGNVMRPGTTMAMMLNTPGHTLSPVAEQRPMNHFSNSGKVVVDDSEDEFGSLAKELAELMSKQVMFE